MKFTKMNGLGNDYVYISTIDQTINTNYKELAIRLSNRNFGIGADGIVLIGKSEVADFSMRIFNADGSEAEMCGNALRCVAKYVFDNKLTEKKLINISTLGGIKQAKLQLDRYEKVEHIKVDMGRALIVDRDIKITTTKGVRQAVHVTIGNPHAVIFVDTTNQIDMAIGKEISENTALFPQRINVEFVKIIDRKNAYIRVYERGAGETLACGTGACASFYAGYQKGELGKKATIHLRGGKLAVEIIKKRIFMTGRAELNYKGEINL